MKPDGTPGFEPGGGLPVVPFAAAAEFLDWLEDHHASASGLWVKFAKKGRGIPSVSFDEALEVAMMFGWVDSKLHRVDEDYYVLRYTPRSARSAWGVRNQRLARQLIDEGRMRPAGLAAVRAAQADGRWTLPLN